jgi:hypothetical protein
MGNTGSHVDLTSWALRHQGTGLVIPPGSKLGVQTTWFHGRVPDKAVAEIETGSAEPSAFIITLSSEPSQRISASARDCNRAA